MKITLQKNIETRNYPKFKDMPHNSWAEYPMNKDFLIYKNPNGSGYWLNMKNGEFIPILALIEDMDAVPIKSGFITIAI